MANKEKPVVFLDRDGTINIEKGYLRNLTDLVLISGAAQAIKRLNEAEIVTVLITNQSGAARNYYPESHIQDLHKRLQFLLSQEGAFLDAVYYCPHLPDGIDSQLIKVCNCRKPATGLIDRAYNEIPGLNKEKSFMIGDKEADMGLALNARVRSIIVRTGYGEETLKILKAQDIQPDFIAADISEGVDWIIQELVQ
jgi:D-glycero-D-manno-heptose 1,7-bisphosphate phosphatase